MLLDVSLARENKHRGWQRRWQAGCAKGGRLHQPAWDRVPTHEGMWAKQVASQKQPLSPQLEAGAKPEAPAPQQRQEQGWSEGHSRGVFFSSFFLC